MQLVVARYRENISWLGSFRKIPIIVYDKSGESAQHALPNVGREAHSYLHHIVKNYDCLAEVTVFLQGDPHCHVPDLQAKIWDLDRDVGFRDLCDHILVEDRFGNPIHPGIGTGEFYEALFEEPTPEYFVCHAAACFAVSRENIRLRPRSFYERALELVISRKMGPWEIERLWQYIFRTRVASRGIVSAADATFFRDLQLLVRSHEQKTEFPMVVVDLGLHPDQLEWCLDAGVGVIAIPPIHKPIEAIKKRRWWQTWLKPFYIFHSPFDQVLWVDADCVITGDLAKAFEIIENALLIVRDGTDAETENPAQLYKYLPIPSDLQSQGVSVNAGVLGLCKIRDKCLLNAWAFGVGWAALNPNKQHLSAWADQGILLWAVLRSGVSSGIQQDLKWNYPGEASQNFIAEAAQNGYSMLDAIRKRYPLAAIVHWLGHNKLSGQIGNEIERLFISGFGPSP